MANPNIVNVTSILGNTDMYALATAASLTILSNAASSGKLIEVNFLSVTNVDGVSNADISVDVHNAAAGGGTGFAISSTNVVPADARLDVINKENPLYLTEDMSITATPSAADDLEIVISYKEIS